MQETFIDIIEKPAVLKPKGKDGAGDTFRVSLAINKCVRDVKINLRLIMKYCQNVDSLYLFPKLA